MHLQARPREHFEGHGGQLDRGRLVREGIRVGQNPSEEVRLARHRRGVVFGDEADHGAAGFLGAESAGAVNRRQFHKPLLQLADVKQVGAVLAKGIGDYQLQPDIRHVLVFMAVEQRQGALKGLTGQRHRLGNLDGHLGANGAGALELRVHGLRDLDIQILHRFIAQGLGFVLAPGHLPGQIKQPLQTEVIIRIRAFRNIRQGVHAAGLPVGHGPVPAGDKHVQITGFYPLRQHGQQRRLLRIADLGGRATGHRHGQKGIKERLGRFRLGLAPAGRAVDLLEIVHVLLGQVDGDLELVLGALQPFRLVHIVALARAPGGETGRIIAGGGHAEQTAGHAAAGMEAPGHIESTVEPGRAPGIRCPAFGRTPQPPQAVPQAEGAAKAGNETDDAFGHVDADAVGAGNAAGVGRGHGRHRRLRDLRRTARTGGHRRPAAATAEEAVASPAADRAFHGKDLLDPVPLAVKAALPGPQRRGIAEAFAGAGRGYAGGHDRDGDRLLRQQAVLSLRVIEGDAALLAVEDLRQSEFDVVGANQALVGQHRAEHEGLTRPQEGHFSRHDRLHHRHRHIRFIGDGQFDLVAVFDLHPNHVPGIRDGLIVQECLQLRFPAWLDLDIVRVVGVLFLADHYLAGADRQTLQGDLAVGQSHAAGQFRVGIGVAHNHQGALEMRSMSFIIRIVIDGIHGQTAGAFGHSRRPEGQRHPGKGLRRIDRQRAAQRGIQRRIAVGRQSKQKRRRLARREAGQGIGADQFQPGQTGRRNRDRPRLVSTIIADDNFKVARHPAVVLRVNLHGDIQRRRRQRQLRIARLGMEISGNIEFDAFCRGDLDLEILEVAAVGRSRTLDCEDDGAGGVARQFTQKQAGSRVIPSHLAVGGRAIQFGLEIQQRRRTAVAQLQRADVDVIHGHAPLDIAGRGDPGAGAQDKAQPENVELILNGRAAQAGITGADHDMAGLA